MGHLVIFVILDSGTPVPFVAVGLGAFYKDYDGIRDTSGNLQ